MRKLKIYCQCYYGIVGNYRSKMSVSNNSIFVIITLMRIITMRKDIYERIKILHMDEIKPYFSELAKICGCDYQTAKKYYHSTLNDQITPLKRKTIPSKLDSYKTIIEDKLKLCCSYYSICEFIKRKGYDGKYTIVRNFLLKI